MAVAVVVEDTRETAAASPRRSRSAMIRRYLRVEVGLREWTDADQSSPRDLFDGRYELLGRQLGAGGMARVYLAHDRLLDRQVAVKVLAERYADDDQFVERFRREASAAAGLNHPNIVAVYDRGEADGTYYIVMEYLAGPDLKEVIRARGAARRRTARSTTRTQILAALARSPTATASSTATSSRTTCSWPRDGTSRSPTSASPAPAPAQMTEAGSIIGTAQYLSPEQARGEEVGPPSDFYAVGIVLYEMLTGPGAVRRRLAPSRSR